MEDTVANVDGGKILTLKQKTWEKIPDAVLVVIGIFVFFNPFPHTTSIREAAYYLGLVLAIAYLIKNRDYSFLKTPLTLPVALFVFWSFLSLFWAIDVETSVHDFRSHLLEYIALFCILVAFFNTPKKLRILFWIIVISVTVSAMDEMFVFYVKGNQSLTRRLIIPNHQLPVGPLGFMSMYAAILSLFLIQFEKRWISKSILAFCLLTLVLTTFVVQTRAILVAMPFAVGVLFWHRKKVLLLFVGLALILGGVTLTKFRGGIVGGTYTDRLTINYISYLVVKEHPLRGIGFGIDTFGNSKFIDHEHYRSQVPEEILHKSVQVTSPHNMWMSVAVRTGLVGFALFVGILLTAFKMCFRVAGESGGPMRRSYGYCVTATFIAFAIYGLFNVVFMHFLEMLLCVSFATIAVVGNRSLDEV
ncbi:MAG TPA: O-antigen ligase family protein [Deltaproteobacteria bacterium]|nr:O-antigen ligase family protein [Deltaproteobacteria bacterium]